MTKTRTHLISGATDFIGVKQKEVDEEKGLKQGLSLERGLVVEGCGCLPVAWRGCGLLVGGQAVAASPLPGEVGVC